jgi:hypothetical protein
MKLEQKASQILSMAKIGKWKKIPRTGADLKIAINSLCAEGFEVFSNTETFLDSLEKNKGVKKIVQSSTIEETAYAIYEAMASRGA